MPNRVTFEPLKFNSKIDFKIFDLDNLMIKLSVISDLYLLKILNKLI